MRIYRSILNDVLGPVMTGPSSSHCAGCCRIGLVTRQLYGKDIEKADIIFDETGSYPNTYIGQGSNYGFIGGLLGFGTDDLRLKNAVSFAKEAGKQIVFHNDDLGSKHPNQAEIRIYENSHIVMRVMTYSIGGGMFQITKLDEFNVSIDGSKFYYFICSRLDKGEYLREILEQHAFSTKLENNSQTGRSLICITSHESCLGTIEKIIGNIKDIFFIRSTTPVVPNVKQEKCYPVFFNAAEAMVYAIKNDRELWQLFEDYETEYGYVSKEDISNQVQRIRIAMEKSMIPVNPETTRQYGFLPYQATGMKEKLALIETVNTGLIEDAMIAAVAVLENSCAHNIVVAAPTAGSSGVIPASIITVGRKLGKSDIDIERALMSAGVVGVFIANQATFGGEVGACQAEIGSACAMAAAGIIQLLGGSIDQSFGAASLALQNMLGLVCDPIAGLTEIPCISRNVAAVSNAITSANMILLGFNPIISLDEVILTMNSVGNILPSELKCTCKGGLCTTKTGCRIEKSMKEKWKR